MWYVKERTEKVRESPDKGRIMIMHRSVIGAELARYVAQAIADDDDGLDRDSHRPTA